MTLSRVYENVSEFVENNIWKINKAPIILYNAWVELVEHSLKGIVQRILRGVNTTVSSYNPSS
jgi:hypothetical protein